MRELKNFWTMIVLVSFAVMVFVTGNSMELSASQIILRALPEAFLMILGYVAMRHYESKMILEEYNRRKRESRV